MRRAGASNSQRFVDAEAADSAHTFTTGREVGTRTKRKPKSKKGGEDDGEMEWWVQYKSEMGNASL